MALSSAAGWHFDGLVNCFASGRDCRASIAVQSSVVSLAHCLAAAFFCIHWPVDFSWAVSVFDAWHLLKQ
eukprot:864694-Alexandrium_andersonii.AAC.1